ncbi:helix-turn-helix domain-containing protein [Dawidia soli]|uniref:Helix-turn-helix domain-containing protein n=1 Tax=Dawidia soli TaxID=2782352 RepID=A0AAP2GHP0_9BACT|nr:helix-turn-helix transcriptional regulator [Dawidia soli]MBT1687396.1 helix-turn-helix domain-containing protein [Dawidia soli]
MDLGKQIQSLRKSKSLTQEDFARECEITQTYLSQIENNQKEPTISVLKKISSVLKVPLPILFYLSIEEGDVAPEKREAFSLLEPSIKSLILGFFAV